MNGDRDGGGVSGHGFVDGVIDDFVDQVVESVEAGAADVHAGALADGFESFQDFDLLGVVVALLWRGDGDGLDGAVGG